jgi:hypothetical protein
VFTSVYFNVPTQKIVSAETLVAILDMSSWTTELGAA